MAKSRKKIKKPDKDRVISVLLIIFLIASVTFYYIRDLNNMVVVQDYSENETVIFSVPSGAYEDTVTLSLSLDNNMPSGSKIYYSVNGSDPRKTRYKKKIELEAEQGSVKLYVVKAATYYNGVYSNTFSRTYLVGDSAYYGIDVLNIVADSDDLYDYNSGILVPGITAETNPELEKGYPHGNYSNDGEEWERDAKITMIDTNGKVVLDKDIGLAVVGGSSTAMRAKSLKLIANYHDKDARFEIDLSNGDFSEQSLVTTYKSVKLHSGSQDFNSGANIRASVMSRLAEQSNFDGCTSTRRCLVFLNGNFYGVYDMQQNYSDSFIRKRYSLDDSSSIKKSKGPEKDVFEDLEIRGYFMTDLNEEENRRALESKVDMENYLTYCAMELLANNTDWPGNNFEAWRYVGEYDENNKYTDGRYRFLIYDSDITFYMEGDEYIIGPWASYNTFSMIMEEWERGEDSVLKNVLSSVYYRDKMLTIMSDLLNTSFKAENILSIIDCESERIKTSEDIFKDYRSGAQKERIDHMKAAALAREGTVREDITKFFGLSELYSLSISCGEGVGVCWNNMRVYSGENYENSYYKGTQFTVSANAYPTYEVECFVVNGEKVYSDTLSITESMIKDGKVNISVSAKKCTDSPLIISEISAKSDTDWLKFKNVGSESVNLSRYYISDDEKNPLSFNLPDITVKSGESFIINCNKNYYEINDYICSFNLSQGETLYLYDTVEKRVVDSFTVPIMDKQETCGRYKDSSQLVHYRNVENERKNVR